MKLLKKDGKLVLKDGKLVTSKECCCGEPGCDCTCSNCEGGKIPAWIKVRFDFTGSHDMPAPCPSCGELAAEEFTFYKLNSCTYYCFDVRDKFNGCCENQVDGDCRDVALVFNMSFGADGRMYISTFRIQGIPDPELEYYFLAEIIASNLTGGGPCTAPLGTWTASDPDAYFGNSEGVACSATGLTVTQVGPLIDGGCCFGCDGYASSYCSWRTPAYIDITISGVASLEGEEEPCCSNFNGSHRLNLDSDNGYNYGKVINCPGLGDVRIKAVVEYYDTDLYCHIGGGAIVVTVEDADTPSTVYLKFTSATVDPDDDPLNIFVIGPIYSGDTPPTSTTCDISAAAITLDAVGPNCGGV